MGRDEENGSFQGMIPFASLSEIRYCNAKKKPDSRISIDMGSGSHLIHVVLTAKEMILMNSNAVRAAIHDRIDPVIEAIITEELRDKGGKQPQSAPASPPSSSLEDVLAPALAAALAPALAPALTAALTPALTAALTAALTPALSAILSPRTHGNGHESSQSGSQPGEGGSPHEGENHNQ